MPRIFSATYTPYTYEELAAPLREATVAHQAVEQNYDTLMTDADKMKAFLKEDWQSYKDYSDYVNRLNLAAEDLARNGLTRQNRANLLQLKRDYDGKIQAINAGILKRENEIENFKKSPIGQSQRYIGQRPEDFSVDDYMYGNNPFKIGVDGSELFKYAQDLTTKTTSRIFDEYSKGGYRISEVGVDPVTTSHVVQALNNGMSIRELVGETAYASNRRQYDYEQSILDSMQGIMDNTKNTFGYNQFTRFENGEEVPTDYSTRFNAEVIAGINSGIQYSRSSQVDQYALKAYDAQLDDTKERYKRYWDSIENRPDFLVWKNPKTMEPAFNENFPWEDYYAKKYGTSDGSGSKSGSGKKSGQENSSLLKDYDIYQNKSILDTDEKLLQIQKNNQTGKFEDKNGGIYLPDNISAKGIVVPSVVDLYNYQHQYDEALKAYEGVIEQNYTNTGGTQAGRRLTKGSMQTWAHDEYLKLQNIRNTSGFQSESQFAWYDMLSKYEALKNMKTDIDGQIEKWESQSKGNHALTEKEYGKIREIYGFQDGEVMTLDAINEKKATDPNYMSEYSQKEYFLGSSDVSEGSIKNDDVVKLMIGNVISTMGENTSIPTYKRIGATEYGRNDNTASKKLVKLAKDDKNKIDGILAHAISVSTTEDLLQHKEGGMNRPLIKIKYVDTDGNHEMIVPADVFGYEFMTATGIISDKQALIDNRIRYDNPYDMYYHDKDFEKDITEIRSTL